MTLVFESSLISLSLLGNLLTMIISFLISYQYLLGKKKKLEKHLSFYVSVCFFVISTTFLMRSLIDYSHIIQAINNDLAKQTKGAIQNFQHIKLHNDTFIINGIKFKYTRESSNSKSYYNKLKGEGSFITQNGQKVKIDYIVVDGENKIIKLWVYK